MKASDEPSQGEGMFKKACPERSRRKGRSHFDARSVRVVRERERREERQVCEPEGGKTARTPLAALRPDSGQAFFNIPQ